MAMTLRLTDEELGTPSLSRSQPAHVVEGIFGVDPGWHEYRRRCGEQLTKLVRPAGVTDPPEAAPGQPRHPRQQGAQS